MFTKRSLPCLPLLLLPACSPRAPQPTAEEAPKQLTLTYVTAAWQVHFEPGSAEPIPGDAAALAQFLDGLGPSARIMLGVTTETPTLDEARERRIDGLLAARHLPAAEVPGADPLLDDPDTVVVHVGRYVVTGPRCPDWSKPEADDFTNSGPSDFGCATLADLGQMVADPADLARGATLGPADGDYATQGVVSYHAGGIDKGVTYQSSTAGSQ